MGGGFWFDEAKMRREQGADLSNKAVHFLISEHYSLFGAQVASNCNPCRILQTGEESLDEAILCADQ